MGVEMYAHQLLHQSKLSDPSSSTNASSPQLNISCNCLDDAFMPLSESTPPVIIAPEKEFVLLFSNEVSHIFSVDKNFLLLRGPPSA
jgi:hypothetical protein